jgi:hypothetical protein
MGVGVDQPRHHHHAAGVDALGFRCDGRRFIADRGDAAVLHQQIAPLENASFGIHGDDHAVFDQQGFGHRISLPTRIAYTFYHLCTQNLILPS